MMSAVFQQDFQTSLDELTDDGAVMQFVLTSSRTVIATH